MGQYWIPINLDKKEFIEPHKLGTGLKLWEQLANHPGTGAALIVLCAAMPLPRGGGDFDMTENWHGPERTFPEHNVSPGPMPSKYPSEAQQVIGRWAGDRIALVGDYAEDSDLKADYPASTLYARCRPKTETAFADAPVEGTFGYWNQEGQYQYEKEIEPPEFTDISELVAKVIEHELQGKYKGEGWKDFIYDSDQQDAQEG